MPWKGLKFGAADDIETRKGAALESVHPPRRSEHIPRQLTQLIPRLSESTTNISKSESPNADCPVLPDHDANEQSKKRSRFNLMRLRHASDPQLSASYKNAEQSSVPPVPPPPKIITTAPTTSSISPQPRPNKRKSLLFKFSSQPEGSVEPPKSLDQPANTEGTPGECTSSTGTLGVRSPHISFEEPERPSTTSLRNSGHRAQGDGHLSLFPAARLSESSRSDASSGDPAALHATSKNNQVLKSSSLFKLPRPKKGRNLLFPLPVKPPPSDPARPSSKQLETHQESEANQERLSPLGSPSRSSFGRGTSTSGSPGPPLLRHNSTTSAHSARSSRSFNASRPAGRRGRSSTVGSLAGIQDVPHQSSPDLAQSGRTSTFTGPRKSFSDLFGISHRLRQSSEPVKAGNGFPGTALPATPGSATSKPNSFSLQRELAAIPPREEGDTPATYLEKLEGSVHRKVIATILCQSAEDFYATALRKYIRRFSFFGDPIDMAIRKLLMEAELPKETQQIDRLLQAFANRYHECNPGIFASTDQAYFIAFSLLILHTDVFNKNNKRKMQKQDYVRNTHGEGVADEILECFYDNICYTPFIHVEDEVNLGPRLLQPKSRNILLKVASSDHLPRASREPVDPYALILDNKLESLRPNLKGVMELEDVYSTGPQANMNDLHRLFYKPCVLQIVSARSRPDAFLTQTSIENPAESHPGLVDIRVAKVGLLWRKDPKKKKTRSPWQEWGAVLTGSQLYFFRDVHWVKSLISQYESNQKNGRRRPVTFTPPVADFKPDTTMSMADAVALLDSSYKKHKHAFLFVRHGGFEEVFLANSEAEMNEWLATLNYAAAFRTTGVRMRGMIGVNYEGQRLQRSTRAGSVTSEASELPDPIDSAPDTERKMAPHQVEEVFAARRELVCRRIVEANEKLAISQKQLDDQLRNARHLQVLTPVHPRARDQVILAAGKMSAKIRWARMEVWRTKCHRDVLAQDLAEEEKYLGIQHRVNETIKPVAQELPSLKVNPIQLNTEHGVDAPKTPASDRPPASPRPGSPALRERSRSPEPLSETSNHEGRRGSVRISLTPSEPSLPARKGSTATSKDELSFSPTTERTSSVPRQASVASRQSRMDVSSLMTVPSSSHRATPSPSVLADDEEYILRENGLLPLAETSAADSTTDHDKMHDGQQDQSPGEHRSKVRRSLHRTLRETHVPHHNHRSKRGKEKASAETRVDANRQKSGKAGLARSSPSFTVHGKKASVVTFGSEWQHMSAEQRLKQRKPKESEALHTEDGTDSLLSEPVQEAKTGSLRSECTATGMSSRSQDIRQNEIVPEVLEEYQESELDGNKGNDKAKDSDSAVAVESSHPSTTTSPSDSEAKDGGSTQPDQFDRADDNKSITQSNSKDQLGQLSPEQTVKA
ncbi:hypothetical protein VTO42DRAFT_6247 [Malbranchea cinnamomea]